MSSYNLTPYIDLVQFFLDERMSAPEFKRSYLKMFKEDNTTEPHNQFNVLNEIFTDADSFYPEPALRDEGDIDETEFKRRCELNITKLRKTV